MLKRALNNVSRVLLGPGSAAMMLINQSRPTRFQRNGRLPRIWKLYCMLVPTPSAVPGRMIQVPIGISGTKKNVNQRVAS